MSELRKIWANARYEMTTLLRGWFFRIFAGLMIFIFIFVNITLFGETSFTPRLFKGFSSSVPYANMIFLNMIQIVICVFLASDFFKRDRKLNTAEAFYIRSMSNASYLFGKAFGIFFILTILNLVILAIAATIHLLFSDISFYWYQYLIYTVLMGFPAYLFIIGFTFILMRLIQSQAIVVLLVLGYFATVLFYLNEKWFYIFDFALLKLPLIYSDFIGLAFIEQVLLQRGLYIALGILCIILTILFFHRLPQSVYVRRFLFLFLIISVLSVILCIQQYFLPYNKQQKLRSDAIALNRQYLERPNITPLFCDLEIYHHAQLIKANVFYIFTNKTNSPLNQYFFSINPGLKVEEIQHKKEKLSFKQTGHIIDIQPVHPLNRGVIDSLSISYTGSVDEAICYLDVIDTTRYKPYSAWLFQLPKKYVFLEENFVLFSPECLWYPKPGLPAGSGFPEKMEKHFISYDLEVHTKPNLTAISQGKANKIEPGHFKFKPEVPMPEISLLIGSYRQQTLNIDSVEYGLYTLPQHNYYEEYFSQLGDTLGSIIKEIKQDFEVKLGFDYPYKRLNLIEVPIQYYVYPRIWTVVQDVVQPEQIWIQENAAFLSSADFKLMKTGMDRRFIRSNQTFTEVETQTTILKSFLNGTFCGGMTRGFRMGGPGGGPSDESLVAYQPDYNIFANFYTHVTYLNAPKWPIFNSALEAFLYDRVKPADQNRPSFFLEGLSEAEQVSQNLTGSSLAERFSSAEGNINLLAMIKQKGAYIIKYLQNEVGIELFESSIKKVISEHYYSDISFDTFIKTLNIPPDFDLDSYLHSWYYSSDLPAFLIYNLSMYKVLDGDRTRHQVIFKISNLEVGEGLVEITFQYGRGGRGMPGGFGVSGAEEPPRLYKIPGKQTQQIGILLDEEPRGLNIDFLIAKNLPILFSTRFEKAELNDRVKPFHGERVLDESALLANLNEIIVDNEDKGFEIFSPPYQSVLKQMIHGEQKNKNQVEYDRLNFWRPPLQWSLVKNASFYGNVVHSAYYIRPGNGQKNVVWKTNIEKSGFYDIYTYMFNTRGFNRGGRDRGDQSTNTFGDFNFFIYHDAGTDNVTLSATQASEGWNYLGSWYLSPGETRVMLTDKSNGRVVLADAIKWVKN